MIPRIDLGRYLERFDPLLAPSAVFFVTAVALGSPIPAIRELASGIFAENLAPRSFWTTLSLTCFAFAVLLLLTRNIARSGPSRTWAALAGPRAQIQGWLVTIGGMSAGLGLFALLLAVFSLSIETLLLAVAALAFADVTVRILQWMGPLGAQFDANYDPGTDEQRKQRGWMIAGMLAISLLAGVAALRVQDADPCSRACGESATGGGSTTPARSAPRTGA